jgi:hypothetical protein
VRNRDRGLREDHGTPLVIRRGLHGSGLSGGSAGFAPLEQSREPQRGDGLGLARKTLVDLTGARHTGRNRSLINVYDGDMPPVANVPSLHVEPRNGIKAICEDVG